MSLLSKVTRAMKKIAPLELAESSWDNVGVLVGMLISGLDVDHLFQDGKL
jgi:putative NIF3 family GTP cyclohydrolase 1 type 2